MKYLIVLLAFVLAPAWAQRPGPDPTYDLRVHPHERYPRWCRGYDRRDYWIERRACGGDRQCRARVNRKAERCGLR